MSKTVIRITEIYKWVEELELLERVGSVKSCYQGRLIGCCCVENIEVGYFLLRGLNSGRAKLYVYLVFEKRVEEGMSSSGEMRGGCQRDDHCYSLGCVSRRGTDSSMAFPFDLDGSSEFVQVSLVAFGEEFALGLKLGWVREAVLGRSGDAGCYIKLCCLKIL